MAIKVNDAQWKCPKCGKVFTKEGYCVQHEKLKHGGDESQRPGKKKDDKAAGADAHKGGCPACGGKNIEIIPSNTASGKFLRSKGYKKYCEDCEEVF